MSVETADIQINAKWLIPVIPENTTFKDCSVVIRGDRLVDICPTAEANRRYRCRHIKDLGNHVLIPGLVNCHNHAGMTLLRGLADDYDLHTWLNDHIWPAEGQWVGEEFVRDGTNLAIAEMLHSGTTCFSDMYFFPDQVAEAARDAGIRCQIAFPILNFPTAWARDGDEYIHKGLALHDSYKAHPLIRVAFGPHAPYTVSDALFERVAIYANELDAGIQIHLHESRAEVEEAIKETGSRPINRLQDLGLLSANTQCVHMVAVNEDDIALVAQSKAHIVHCPKSNMKLGNGASPVAEMIARGVNVALGSDGAASNNSLDMFSEMQFAALLAKGTSGDASVLDAHQVLRMATINGARALGMEDTIGSIETGKAADLVAIDLSGLSQAPVYNPGSQLLYTQAGANVSHVWVAGKALVDNGKLTTVHEGEISAKASHWQRKIAP